MLNGYTDMTDKDDECELGYWLGEPFWGRGYMPEAAHWITIFRNSHMRNGLISFKEVSIWQTLPRVPALTYFYVREEDDCIVGMCGGRLQREFYSDTFKIDARMYEIDI